MPTPLPDALLCRLYSLFCETEKRIDPRLDADLAGAVLLVWIEQATNPSTSAKAINLASQEDGYIANWFVWRAREVLRKWLKEEHAELDDEGTAIEWREPETKSIGEREPGEYIGTLDELSDLFRRVEQTGQPIADEIHPVDLQTFYASLDEESRLSLRMKLSGYSEGEIGRAANARLGRGLRKLRTA